MPLDQVIIFVLTYLLTHLLNRWPDFKNEGLPRMAWIIAILQQTVTNLMGVGEVHAVAPAYAAAAMSWGVPAQAALPLGGDVASFLAGTKVFIATQVAHLVFEKLLPSFFRKLSKQGG